MRFNVVKRGRGWRVFLVTWNEGKKSIKHVPVAQYPHLGLRPDMTLAEARDLMKALNTRDDLRRRDQERLQAAEHAATRAKIEFAFLPKALVERFEAEQFAYLPESHKSRSYWKRARKTLCDLRLEPREYVTRSQELWRYFANRRVSLDYAKKILSMMNRWGKFMARETGEYFEELAIARGTARENIVDSYYEEHGRGNESVPLTPAMLRLHGGKLGLPQLFWVELSLWFGLRPKEVDALHDPKRWGIEHQGGYKILKVFQSKLSSIPRDQRWKRVPVVEAEQRALFERLIQGELFSRPLVKTLQKHIDPGLTCYGGRKGFTDLMLSRGHAFEAISQWLGHRSLDQTWRAYKDKTKLILPAS